MRLEPYGLGWDSAGSRLIRVSFSQSSLSLLMCTE